MIATLRAVFLFAPRSTDSSGASGRRRRELLPADTVPVVDDADHALVERISAGDAESFGVVFRQYYAALCGYATRQLGDVTIAEELVMDLFRHVWEERRTLRLRGTFRAYLFSAVHHATVNALRDRATRTRLMTMHAAGHVPALGTTPAAPSTDAERGELRQAIDAAVAALPERLRQAFALRWEQGLSGREIAAVMGVSDKAAEQYLVRAARQLRLALQRFREG